MSITMDYSWYIFGVIIVGFILVSVLVQILNRNPAE
jgi:hypothetical protein